MKISTINNFKTVKPYTAENKKNYNSTKKMNNPSFKASGVEGAFNILNKFFSVLDKNAMIQVSFVDTISTNIPRTLVDLGTGLAAAFETCRREFSGLFVNCLMPGLVVKGLAKLLPKSQNLKGTSPANSWANSDSIEKLTSTYKEAIKSGSNNVSRTYVEKAINSIEGLDGKNWVKYSDKAQTAQYKEAVSNIVDSLSKKGTEKKKLLKNAQNKLAEVTRAENVLKFNGKSNSNLEETIRDIADLGSKFNITAKKAGGITENTADKVAASIDNYSESLNKFVNKKSLIGLGIVLAIAVSVQKINRAITRKQFNAEGAPIYKDFGKKDTQQKMDDKKKKQFFGEKLIAAIGMYGLAAASMMKKPTLGMFQFSGIFPTMDQCRWIASSTFASRMLASEDENELRETFVRDIASFSGLYFLGDYVKKGTASIIEALSKTEKGASIIGENVVLLNRKKEIAKPVIKESENIGKKLLENGKYRAKQFGNWVKNTELKTASEVSSIKIRNLRNLCRVADIAFSIIMLGILLPKYNRAVTNKKVEKEKQLKLEQDKNMVKFDKKIQDENKPKIFEELT